MPKKIANKDLPAVADVIGGEKLAGKLERAKARLEKTTGAEGAEAEKVRAARKALKRGQRKLRKARIHTATRTPKKAAAEG